MDTQSISNHYQGEEPRQCPMCGSVRRRIYRTYKPGDHLVVRYCACSRCSKRYQTHQIPAGQLCP